MMRKLITTTLFISMLALLSACAQSASTPPQALAVEQHLQAMANRDEARFSQGLCENWTLDAFLEYDSLSMVQPKLENVACRLLDSTGSQATVQCSGEIVATYGNEVQRFPLDNRVYHLELQSGEWLVCGYTQ